VEESLQLGASVALVARRHEVNANSVFAWRRLYEKGLMGTASQVLQAPLLPVTVAEAASPPRAQSHASKASAAEGLVEIELAGGGIIRVHGELARSFVHELIASMLAR
jgi:transposase